MDYLSCRIQMYLNRNFHSNPTLSHSRFGYFIVDYLYFFYPRKQKHLGLLSELEGMSQDFWKPANYYNLGKQSPLTILFGLLLHSLPMIHPL